MAKRSLLCVSLIGREIPEDLSNRYWLEIEGQIDRLERSFGEVSKIYHEANYLAGEAGLKNVERMNERSYRLARRKIERGAELQALEEKETFLEIADCQLFLTLRFSSRQVLEKVSKLAPEISEFYEKALRKRREHIPAQISETLGAGETGMLLMREEERMKIQFPSEIDVILVRPPVLSEVERWQRDQQG